MTPALELLIRTCDTNFGNMEAASLTNTQINIARFSNLSIKVDSIVYEIAHFLMVSTLVSG